MMASRGKTQRRFSFHNMIKFKWELGKGASPLSDVTMQHVLTHAIVLQRLTWLADA